MVKKETSVGGKRLAHKDGYINKGILWNGVVYPIFSDKQTGKTWNILSSIKSKNIKKADLDGLKSVITNARTRQDAEDAYVSLNKARGIKAEVSIKALELANNRIARQIIGNMSSNEILDFNKVSRDKVSLRVLEGNQDTTPIIEEVSGQGTSKDKVIKPSKVEEPGKLNKQEQEKKLNEIVKEGLDAVVKYMVDGGYKIVNDTLDALYEDLIGVELRKAQRIGDVATTIYKKLETLSPYVLSSLILKGVFPLADPALVYGGAMIVAGIDDMINPKTLEQIENEVVDQKELNEIVESKRIEFKKQDIKLMIEDSNMEDIAPLLKKEDLKPVLEDLNLTYEQAKDKMNKYVQEVRSGGDKKQKYKEIWGIEMTQKIEPQDILINYFVKNRDELKQRRLEDEAMKEAIDENPMEERGAREGEGKRNIQMEIKEVSQEPAKQTETSGEVREQIQEKLMEQEGTAGYSFKEGQQDGLDLDDEEDIGIHNEAIQRVSTMNDYDYTFTKKSLLQVNPLPNDPKMLRKMGERCIREYGHLLGILAPKDNFSKKEVEELYTLKHILKQVIRLEAQYKRALLKMRVASGSNQLDKLMANGQLGLVMNAGSMNVSPQKAVEQMSSSPLQAQAQQATAPREQDKPVDVFQELGEKKIKGKGKDKERRRMDIMYQRKRKAMLRQPKNIVLRGRINDPPQYQNLRSEAERLNENPIPIAFKSNNRMNQMRRFNVNY